MPRTYESTMAEIERLNTEIRAIFDKDEPSADDKAHVLKAQGEIEALQKVAHDLHEAEVAEARAAAERAVPVDERSPREKARELRQRLKEMRPGEEITLVTEERALGVGSGSGSYLVPQEWHDKVEEYRFATNWLRPAGAMVIKTESTHNIPVLTANGTAQIVEENNPYPNNEPTINPVVLGAYKLADTVVVSEELLEDAIYPVEDLLARSMGYAFGAAELGYAMTGTGTGQPTGIFNKSADMTTATSGTITADELVEAVYKLQQEYRDGCVWMMDTSAGIYIAKMKTPVQTSGGQTYQWPGMLDGVNPTLLGYPVKFASAIADFAAGAKAIALGNPRAYVIGERGPMKVKRLELSPYQTTFAFSQRYDSKPLNPNAFVVIAIKSVG